MSTISIVNLDKFKDTCLLSITLTKWGNSTKVKDMAALAAYIAELEKKETQDDATDAKPEPTVIIPSQRVKSTKKLIKSATYEALCRELTDIKAWCIERSMPSFFRAGMFVVKKDQVGVIEKEINRRLEALRKPLNAAKDDTEARLERFLAAYPADVETSRTAAVKKGGLGPLFVESDYPTVDELRKLFNLDWNWLNMGVAENLPDELKEREGEKFKRRLMDAAQDIENALRSEFAELIKHAQERLTTAPGEAPKVFRESLIGNLTQFIETFNSKDVFGDERLAGVVAKAKAVLLDDKNEVKYTPDALRKFANKREEARAEFAKISEELAGMIEEKSQRRFDLTED